MKHRASIGTVVATVASLLLASLAVSVAQAQTAAANASDPPPAGTAAATFKQEELEQILAPIALYPDALLAQIFMASTYPLEVVEAARWSKEHPDVKGDAVAGAVKDHAWDPSVKSLVAFPQVLTMMNEKIDWTQKLGDAFLAQQKDVMQTVQVLRDKAKKTGNLDSTKEVTVKQEVAPAGSPAPQTIIIESKDPEVIYVPTYNPTVVYGGWPYPAYPPYYYYPPGYVAGVSFWSFSAGVIVGGAIWGNCNWGRSDIDIDVNRQINFNRNEIHSNRTNIDRRGGRTTWSHDTAHRRGVGYRDTATQRKFNRGADVQRVAAREQYRGHATGVRTQPAREVTGDRNARNAGGAREMGGSGAARAFHESSGRVSGAFGTTSGTSARAFSHRGGTSRGAGARSRR